eukprot:352386-Chlamydomonas_euryale.AAC.4
MHFGGASAVHVERAGTDSMPCGVQAICWSNTPHGNTELIELEAGHLALFVRNTPHGNTQLIEPAAALGEDCRVAA